MAVIHIIAVGYLLDFSGANLARYENKYATTVVHISKDVLDHRIAEPSTSRMFGAARYVFGFPDDMSHFLLSTPVQPVGSAIKRKRGRD